jgi:hypothetical protein
MDILLFFVLPSAVAAGSAIICYVLMQARMEVAVAREKTARAHIEARLEMVEEMLPEKLKVAEEAAERRAFDRILSGFRVEERRQLRDGAVPSLVMQERLYFRNMPLSAWIEHELPNGTHNADSLSVFTNPANLMQLAAAISAPTPAAEAVTPAVEATDPVRTRGPQLIRSRRASAAV